MHYFWMFLVWMVYSILAIGVLEAYSERETQSIRGARTAIMVGALIAITLSVVILWFGPVGSW
jgi:hypothetical protein